MKKAKKQRKNYKIKIYKEDHPPPHCHVLFKNGTAICVSLPLVEPMYGETLDRSVKEDILNNLDSLVEEWEEFYPKKQKKVTNKKK